MYNHGGFCVESGARKVPRRCRPNEIRYWLGRRSL